MRVADDAIQVADDVLRVCPAAQLQQTLLSFGRSTRKLIRDVMEEQQRALDILSDQVKWDSPCTNRQLTPKTNKIFPRCDDAGFSIFRSQS